MWEFKHHYFIPKTEKMFSMSSCEGIKGITSIEYFTAQHIISALYGDILVLLSLVFEHFIQLGYIFRWKVRGIISKTKYFSIIIFSDTTLRSSEKNLSSYLGTNNIHNLPLIGMPSPGLLQLLTPILFSHYAELFTSS